MNEKRGTTSSQTVSTQQTIAVTHSKHDIGLTHKNATERTCTHGWKSVRMWAGVHSPYLASSALPLNLKPRTRPRHCCKVHTFFHWERKKRELCALKRDAQ